MATRFIKIKGEPTVSQMLAAEEFKEYHYLFIDNGGTMRATDDTDMVKSFNRYVVVEGMNLSGGYPTVDAEHIAVYCDENLKADNKIEINGVKFDINVVPARFRHLVDIYTELRK